MGVSPPQMHITGISCPTTLIQHKSELHSTLRYGTTTAQSTILQVMFITLQVPALAAKLSLLSSTDTREQ